MILVFLDIEVPFFLVLLPVILKVNTCFISGNSLSKVIQSASTKKEKLKKKEKKKERKDLMLNISD